jgi:RNA polymerase sigma-70 factor, ECF subfamily
LKEIELLKKIRETPAAFTEVFQMYYQPIFGYILRRTGNFDDSADLAANTFFKAFTHINQFTYNGISIKVWLYRIATNEVNQFFRHHKKHHSLFERFDFTNKEEFMQYMQDDKEQLEAELHRHAQFMTVLKALKTLPEKYQEVISLKYFEGKGNQEIAEILSLNEGTLKSLLSRGLEKMRERCNEM